MVMRAKGNFRLILNAAMWKGQTFTKMEGGKGPLSRARTQSAARRPR